MAKQVTQKERRALSLFSGAGGMDIGVRNGGFLIGAAIENDEHCCSTLRENITREKSVTEVLEQEGRSWSLVHSLPFGSGHRNSRPQQQTQGQIPGTRSITQ